MNASEKTNNHTCKLDPLVVLARSVKSKEVITGIEFNGN
jgi:hypothetical protein